MSNESGYVMKGYKMKLDDYYHTGKLGINKRTLKKNRLTIVYYPSLSSHGKFKSSTISDEAVDFIRDICENGRNFDMSPFQDLSPEEQQKIMYFLNISGYGREINFNFGKSLADRLKVLQGEIIVGNDNDDIKTEAIQVINMLIDLGKIKQKIGNEMINEMR